MTERSAGGLRVRFERQVVHPEWNPDSLHYDFALLKLETGLNLPEYPEIRPICWPTMPPQPDTDVSYGLAWKLILEIE